MVTKTKKVLVQKKYSKEEIVSFVKSSFPVSAKITLKICSLWTDHLYRLNFWGTEEQGIIKSYFIEVKETLDGLMIKNYDKEDVEKN